MIVWLCVVRSGSNVRIRLWAARVCAQTAKRRWFPPCRMLKESENAWKDISYSSSEMICCSASSNEKGKREEGGVQKSGQLGMEEDLQSFSGKSKFCQELQYFVIMTKFCLQQLNLCIFLSDKVRRNNILSTKLPPFLLPNEFTRRNRRRTNVHWVYVRRRVRRTRRLEAVRPVGKCYNVDNFSKVKDFDCGQFFKVWDFDCGQFFQIFPESYIDKKNS